MKYIHIVIGIAIIVIGASILSITINNEIVQNIMLKIIGFGVLLVGAFYLKRVAKFGKQ